MRPRALAAPVLFLVAACNAPGEEAPLGSEVRYTEERAPCTARSPTRQLLFGDLHVHTHFSWDANGYELAVAPAQSYAFARGGTTLLLPPRGSDGRGTRPVRLDRPLDFAAVTDHAEYLGEVQVCRTPGSPTYDSPACREFRAGDENAVTAWGTKLVDPAGGHRSTEICGADGAACATAAGRAWSELREAAASANDRSSACSFVAFLGYEYTATPQLSNQHRNVIFRNDQTVALPVSYYERPKPPALWNALDAQCLQAGTGCDVLLIPHNSNWSNGTLFSLKTLEAQAGKEKERALALRARLEPVVEIMQHKGDMECTNGLDGPPDPQCDFEKLRRGPLPDCGDGTGFGGVKDLGCVSRLDFFRGLLLEGLREDRRTGTNPLRLGALGSTDTHNGIAGHVTERGFPGHVGIADDAPADRLGEGNLTHRGWVNNPGGLAAVWAVERSRDAIFEAIRRREVYSTSGPRLQVRLFGGWGFADDLCDARDLAAQGYRQGVPMGSVLPPVADPSSVPQLVVEALADPGNDAHPGTPLAQLQIVKGWVGEDGQRREQVFTVAGATGPEASVDPLTCRPRNSRGARRLCALFRDTSYRPGERAFYYARVLEEPSCRWSAFECLALPENQRPPSCSDHRMPSAIQERAITSPVWTR
ncbi:MAG: DUF3604 domain-containing protein [Deltaproteobacteria bacterium]|nr:DUF3604 domain-containing protein [Deltaproteobacteria bacterium]